MKTEFKEKMKNWLFPIKNYTKCEHCGVLFHTPNNSYKNQILTYSCPSCKKTYIQRKLEERRYFGLFTIHWVWFLLIPMAIFTTWVFYMEYVVYYLPSSWDTKEAFFHEGGIYFLIIPLALGLIWIIARIIYGFRTGLDKNVIKE